MVTAGRVEAVEIRLQAERVGIPKALALPMAERRTPGHLVVNPASPTTRAERPAAAAALA